MGVVVGHVLFSPVTVAIAYVGFRALGLAPVAALPEHQRQGAGSQLIREGLRLCEQTSVDAVVVLGDPRYYSRFGFVPASGYGLENEYGAGDEFMALEIRKGGLGSVRGLVQYAAEFRVVD